MTLIKDILKLDINEDIKKVIDLEDQSESEIQDEIEHYIITPKLSEYFTKFISIYKSNIRETGVWISGFYGSGKSYFGKTLGNLLSDPLVNGTRFRERFIKRLAGLPNESLLENQIRGLNTIKTKVVFLDVAKQNTEQGLSWTLFKNFLKSFGFLDNTIGYLEYGLFLNGEYDEFCNKVEEIEGMKWDELKKEIQHPVHFRRILTKYKYNENEYKDLKENADNTIQYFDAIKLKEHMQFYLSKYSDEKIIFIFDEASEAISQGKYKIIDLEGISESLSSISQSVWTMAIAQEKLDDVINNANVSRRQLTKVTDRFKTQIHLESTEVEYIIENRLLLKKDSFLHQLQEFCRSNIGKISDVTNLKAIFSTRTENDDFAIYYPFHKYQFRLLQNFLFKSNILAKSQIAERGMIITTFDILRNRLKNKELYGLTTSFDITNEAQLNPPIDLNRKYDKAKHKLLELKSPILGEELLKGIHFINESEHEVTANIENITKCYIDNIEDYYKVKPEIEKALEALEESNILISSNGVFKIASDQEQRLIGEMQEINVELFVKKRRLIELLTKNSAIKSLGMISIDNTPFPFGIITDQEDELVHSSNKYLKIRIYSLYNIDKNLPEFVESKKSEFQSEKNAVTIIPGDNQFEQINKLIEEIYRYEQIEKRYGSDNDQTLRTIVKEFSAIRMTKESKLNDLVDQAYLNSTALYLFKEYNLTADNFRLVLNDLQKKLVNNNYTKRLSANISEDLAKRVLKESNASNLKTSFVNLGGDFDFFDNNGNFIGNNLKVIEEIVARIKNTFVDGRSLEEMLKEPPCGYTYGTINTALAVLLRSGRLVVRYNSVDYFDYSNEEVLSVFTSSTRFKSSSFKAITKALTLEQKRQIVEILLDIRAKDIIKKQIDFNINDFELVNDIYILSNKLVERASTLKNTVEGFSKLFPQMSAHVALLTNFNETISANNYIEKADDFLNSAGPFKDAVNYVRDTENFIAKKLPLSIKQKLFVENVVAELGKIGGEYKNTKILDMASELGILYSSSLLENFSEIGNIYQKIRDEYYNMMNKDHQIMKDSHVNLKVGADKLISKINKTPIDLNSELMVEAQNILEYAEKRICSKLDIDQDVACKNCKFTLYEIYSSNENLPSKFSKLIDIDSRIRTKNESIGEDIKSPPRKITLTVPKGITTVGEYKKILNIQLNEISKLDNSDEIDLDINIDQK